MTRFTGHGFPMRLHWQRAVPLVLAAVWCLVGGAGAVAQIRVGGELGWEGRAVVGEVNPLTITIENGTSTILIGTLVAEQRVGSAWRGQATQRLEAPLVLAPGGRARFAFPWPVEAGSEPVAIRVQGDGVELARATIPLRLAVEKPVAIVGTWVGELDAGPVVFLAPEEIPPDPFFLSPFSRIRIASPATVPAPSVASLRAWAAYGGGEVEGLPTVPSVSPPTDADLRAALRLHPPRPPPLGALIGGTALYLFLLGFALPPLARRARSPWISLLLIVSLAFSLMYGVLCEFPPSVNLIQYRLLLPDDIRFSLDTLLIVPQREGVWEVAGWWVERVPAGGERVATVVEWVEGGDGPRTRVALGAGQAAALWRYGPAWVEGGEEVVVGQGGRVDVGAAFAPLVAAIGAAEGDRLFLDWAKERWGEVAVYTYRLRGGERD